MLSEQEDFFRCLEKCLLIVVDVLESFLECQPEVHFGFDDTGNGMVHVLRVTVKLLKDLDLEFLFTLVAAGSSCIEEHQDLFLERLRVDGRDEAEEERYALGPDEKFFEFKI